MKSGNSRKLSESSALSCYKISKTIHDIACVITQECTCGTTYDILPLRIFTDRWTASNYNLVFVWWYLSYLASGGQQATLVFCTVINYFAIWFLIALSNITFHNYSIFWNPFHLFLECQNLWSLPLYSR